MVLKSIVKRPPVTLKAGLTFTPPLPSTPPECLVRTIPQAELKLQWNLDKALLEIRRYDEARRSFRELYSELTAPGRLVGWILHPGVTLEPASESDLD